MSIVAIMTQPRGAPPAADTRTRTRGSGETETLAASPDVLAQLTRYIPTEAVALYVAILPFMVPKDKPLTTQDFTSRWVLAGAVATVAVLFAVGVYRRARVERGEAFRWPLRRTLTVLLAYVAWVFAIPASPLNDFGWYTASLGAVVGISTSVMIALLHLWFGAPEE
jgi:hypothetical protein